MNNKTSKKITGSLLISFFVFVFIVIPTISLAADASGSYTLLAPLPLSGNGTDTSVPLGGDSFGNYLNNAFKIGITVAVLLAVIMIVIAGIQYMGGDSVFNKEDAKHKIWGAIGGLILALGIYIFLSTINPNLVNLNLKIEAVRQVAPTTTLPPITTQEQGALMNAVSGDPSTRQVLLNGLDARNIGRVFVNKPACTAYGQTDCTNVGGLGQSAIDGLMSLSRDCGVNCRIEVTGGTEWWLHSEDTSHRPGNSVVDLSPVANLNRYLTGSTATPTNGTTVTKNGVIYKFETTGANGVSTGNHWHVRF